MSQSSTPENLQKNVRKYIFEHFEEHATAPVLEQIMRKFGLDRASAFNALVDLQSARHIALRPRHAEDPDGVPVLQYSDTFQS